MRSAAVLLMLLGFVFGAYVLHHIWTLKLLPMWTYFAFFAAIASVFLSFWTLAAGVPPTWTLPDTLTGRCRFLHPKVFFWESWHEVSREAFGEGRKKIGHEVIVVMCVVAFSLTIVEYFGDRYTLQRIWPEILKGKYGDLIAFSWWSLSRFGGYVVIPSASIILTPGLSFRNCGLSFKGFFSHVWVYAVLFSIVLPVVAFISFKHDFKTYYPFYDDSARSWFDFLAWEALYALQFLSLEFLFRGYMLHPLKKHIGAYAIFAMIMPYCMIHYGKPFLEPNAAILAGVVLGTLSLRTGSIWCGVLIHVTVAVSMDIAALAQRGELLGLLGM